MLICERIPYLAFRFRVKLLFFFEVDSNDIVRLAVLTSLLELPELVGSVFV